MNGNAKVENFDNLKNTISGSPKYVLSNARVFVSPTGYHYIDYLDPVEDISPDIGEIALTDEDVSYIEKSLQSNPVRFENQVDIIKRYLQSIQDKKILDIGCGGGLFLSKLKDFGATVKGIELNNIRAQYAKNKYNLNIVKRPIEEDYWIRQYPENFDAITLWDVIEHVNYPLSTLRASVSVLRRGGYLFIDTPCRDSFYHRFGEISYKLSRGKFPTFLNSMYSSHKFGHKQIFSSSELRILFEKSDLEIIEVRKFHELSFPYSFYLKKIFRSNLLVKLMLPMVHILLYAFPIKNKILVVGRKQ